MEIFLIIVIVLLVVALVFFIFKNLSNQKKIDYYKMISSNITTMSVIQKMFEILGTNMLASKKIEELNKVILDTYSPRYSTISIFDGNGYEAKASNVEEEYLDCIINVAEDNDFKQNVAKNVSKYITTTVDKTLNYQSASERKIRSAMFCPIYYNNTYLGFWLIEDEADNAFDSISKDEIAKLKSNLGIFIDNVEFQDTIEIADSKDKQTQFFNSLYLYSNVRNELAKYDSSVITAISIDNIPEINEKYGRSTGNEILTKVVNIMKETVSKDDILVRYSGIKLLIIIPNCSVEQKQEEMERILTRFKTISLDRGGENVIPNIKIIMHTFRKQNNIEKEIQKMTRAIDGMKDINTIKII